MFRLLPALAIMLVLLIAAFGYAYMRAHETAEVAPMTSQDQVKYEAARTLYLKCIEISQRNPVSLDDTNRLRSDAFEALRGESTHPSVVSARNKLNDCVNGLIEPEVPSSRAPCNNSFKPSPLRGLGSDRAASGGPA